MPCTVCTCNSNPRVVAEVRHRVVAAVAMCRLAVAALAVAVLVAALVVVVLAAVLAAALGVAADGNHVRPIAHTIALLPTVTAMLARICRRASVLRVPADTIRAWVRPSARRVPTMRQHSKRVRRALALVNRRSSLPSRIARRVTSSSRAVVRVSRVPRIVTRTRTGSRSALRARTARSRRAQVPRRCRHAIRNRSHARRASIAINRPTHVSHVVRARTSRAATPTRRAHRVQTTRQRAERGLRHRLHAVHRSRVVEVVVTRPLVHRLVWPDSTGMATSVWLVA